MTLRTMRFGASLFVLALSLLLTLPAFSADGRMIRIPTREGVVVPTYWLKQDNAPATLILLSGGAGTIGTLDDSGWPGGRNFLIRSGKLFADQGFNIAMVARPSDVQGLDPAFRTSTRHLEDMHKVLEFLRKQSDAPIWIVATSQSTISAAAVAIAERDSRLLGGVVLTSSFTNFKYNGAVPRQALEQINVPVLVMHHEKDACALCRPYEVPLILKGLKNSPIKKQIMVDGGSGATGDPCEAEHYHGFIGMEKEAVDTISGWIRSPTP
jgi:pimeloyl-ACP methyl ester carboxylesterase